ncbi:hypothetical protein [Gordonia phthalatica]|uniref:Uncharacterized protein n=1 Tax=Gordonia phthalatica TaxID=1136941 RepID=A0A0N9MMF7_9ACTN|nr:hypothetical protein [Gordonia phthalatica]ALG83923.1 hypothetical protein ACH46_04605 [Gordonia phthalatica]
MLSKNSKAMDVLVLGFTALLVIAFLGMMWNLPAAMFLTTPLMVALLLNMSVVECQDPARRRSALIVIHTYNVLSFILWAVALWGLHQDLVIGGLPISTAVILYFAWPFYTVVSGLMYAATSKWLGLVDAVDADEARV